MHHIVLFLLIVMALTSMAHQEVHQYTDDTMYTLSAATTQGAHLYHLGSQHDESNIYPYNESDASIMVRLSAASYCASTPQRNKLEQWQCGACKDSGIDVTDITRFNISKTKTNGYVGYIKAVNRIIVVFTGSINIENWITNLDFGFTQYQNAPKNHLVHKGFYSAYKTSRPIVFALVAELLDKYPSATITITGHSLGGALANHMALDLANNTPVDLYNVAGIRIVVNGNQAYDQFESLHDYTIYNSIKSSQIGHSIGAMASYNFTVSYPIITFGQPRIGNPNFSSFAQQVLGNTGIYRVTHHQDPVPHLPPRAFDFKHATTEVYYPLNSKQFKVCSQSDGEDKSCSRQFLLPIGLLDHLNYVNYNIANIRC